MNFMKLALVSVLSLGAMNVYCINQCKLNELKNLWGKKHTVTIINKRDSKDIISFTKKGINSFKSFPWKDMTGISKDTDYVRIGLDRNWDAFWMLPQSIGINCKDFDVDSDTLAEFICFAYKSVLHRDLRKSN